MSAISKKKHISPLLRYVTENDNKIIAPKNHMASVWYILTRYNLKFLDTLIRATGNDIVTGAFGAISAMLHWHSRCRCYREHYDLFSLSIAGSDASVYRADSRLAPIQRETSLQSNAVPHWLGANLESALVYIRYLKHLLSQFNFSATTLCVIENVSGY